ncbi:MAG: hypothetical protein K8R36_11930 [Planctomycetales bacterium]|nr:hypothetical protein [Planctomycetales bacterium]
MQLLQIGSDAGPLLQPSRLLIAPSRFPKPTLPLAAAPTILRPLVCLHLRGPQHANSLRHPQPNSLPPNFVPSGDSSLTERRGASLTKANLGGPARSSPSSAREEPIRIPDDSASAGTLASVIPIRGIPMTDATGLFEQIRSQLAPATGLATRPRNSSGFVEISQLPNPPADVRRAALSRQELR